ncbi:MAG: right-handed parallel beta-helix repeat-containing protein [Myxococcota bacterium]
MVGSERVRVATVLVVVVAAALGMASACTGGEGAGNETGSGAGAGAATAVSTGGLGPGGSGGGAGAGGDGDAPPAADPYGCDETSVSTDALGWQPGADVTSELTSILATLETGATLCFDALYEVSPPAETIEIPDGVVLSAQVGGGLRVRDVPSLPNRGLFSLGEGVVLDNLTIIDEGELTGDDAATVNNRRLLLCDGKTNIVLHHVAIDVYTKEHLRMVGCRDLRVTGSSFRHGYFQLLVGASSGLTVETSLFADSAGDGIKTGFTNDGDVHDIVVRDSAFEGHARDGIDTTGGFRDSLVSGSVFRDSFSGLDIKTIYENEKDTQLPSSNRNIRIENCEFIDTGSAAVVITTLDRVTPQHVTDANAATALAHDVTITDSIIEKTDGGNFVQAFLVKDGHGITWSNLQLLGGLREARIYGNDGSPPRPTLNMTNWNVGGDVVEGPSRGPTSHRPFDVVGPR